MKFKFKKLHYKKSRKIATGFEHDGFYLTDILTSSPSHKVQYVKHLLPEIGIVYIVQIEPLFPPQELYTENKIDTILNFKTNSLFFCSESKML